MTTAVSMNLSEMIQKLPMMRKLEEIRRRVKARFHQRKLPIALNL